MFLLKKIKIQEVICNEIVKHLQSNETLKKMRERIIIDKNDHDYISQDEVDQVTYDFLLEFFGENI